MTLEIDLRQAEFSNQLGKGQCQCPECCPWPKAAFGQEVRGKPNFAVTETASEPSLLQPGAQCCLLGVCSLHSEQVWCCECEQKLKVKASSAPWGAAPQSFLQSLS